MVSSQSARVELVPRKAQETQVRTARSSATDISLQATSSPAPFGPYGLGCRSLPQSRMDPNLHKILGIAGPGDGRQRQ